MTVELVCGRFTTEETDGAVKIIADFVRHDDLKLSNNEIVFPGEMPQEKVNETIGAIPKKQLIKALSDKFEIDELVEIDCDPEVYWRSR